MNRQLPSLKQQLAHVSSVYLQAEEHIFESEIKPRITAKVIAEHKALPVGRHSDELERVLIYLRKNHMVMAGKYILVCTKPHEEWRIAVLSGKPGVPPELLEDSFSDQFEAEHGLFVKRLKDNGLLPEELGGAA